MFFFGLAVFILPAVFLPWWGLALVAAVLGWWRSGVSLQLGTAAGLVWFTTAYVRDAGSSGLISLRMSGALGLPSPWLMLVLMFSLGFVTTVLFAQAGSVLRKLAGR